MCCRRLRPWSHSFFPCPFGRRPWIFAAGLAGCQTSHPELFGRRAAAAVERSIRGALRTGHSFAPDGCFPRHFGPAGRFHVPLQPAFAGHSDFANRAGSPDETWIAALDRFGSAGFAHATAEEVEPQLKAPGQEENLRSIHPIECAHALAGAAHRPVGHHFGPLDDSAVAASLRHAHADFAHLERLGAVTLQREIFGGTAPIDPQLAPVYAAYPLLAFSRLALADLVAAFAPRCRRVDFSPVRTDALASLLVVRKEILGEILQIGPPGAVAAAASLDPPDLLASRDPVAALAHRCVRASALREKGRRLEVWAGLLPSVSCP